MELLGTIPAEQACPHCGGAAGFRMQPTALAGDWRWFVYCPCCGLECGGLQSLEGMQAFWEAYVGCAKGGSK